MAHEKDDQDSLGVVAKQLVVNVHHQPEGVEGEPANAESEGLKQQLLAGHTTLSVCIDG